MGSADPRTRPAAPTRRGEPLLSIEALTKEYPGVVALDAVDLAINQGEVHALLGENGAGKSTLIKIVSGAVAADAGVLQWDGEPLKVRKPADARRHGVSVM